MGNIKNLISLKEASNISGYHPDYLSQLIRSGKLEGNKVGRNWVTTHEAVTEYLATQKFVPIHKLASAKKRFYGATIYIVAILFFLGLFLSYVYNSTNATTAYKIKNPSILDASAGDSVAASSNQ